MHLAGSEKFGFSRVRFEVRNVLEVVCVIIAVRNRVVLHRPVENRNFKGIAFFFEFAFYDAVKNFRMRYLRSANVYFLSGIVRAAARKTRCKNGGDGKCNGTDKCQQFFHFFCVEMLRL